MDGHSTFIVILLQLETWVSLLTVNLKLLFPHSHEARGFWFFCSLLTAL